MQHFLAAPRAMAAAVTKPGWRNDADALPDARRLLILTTLAIGMLAVTVFAVAMFAVGQINETGVTAERERAQAALATMAAMHTPAWTPATIAGAYALDGARFGDAAQLQAGEVAVPVPGRPGTSLIWTPRLIGWELFYRLAPLRIGASLVFLAGILMLLRRLYLLARELEERRREAQALASRDVLTGLGNRLAFDEALARALGSGSGEAALFYLDLDGFKQVNDTLGHGAGDDVLRIVGERLRRLARPDDTVARLGGDEFALVRPGRGGREELIELAKWLETVLREPIVLGTRPLAIGASIGIAAAPGDGRDAAGLLQAADAALYRAKRDRSGFAMAA